MRPQNRKVCREWRGKESQDESGYEERTVRSALPSNSPIFRGPRLVHALWVPVDPVALVCLRIT